MVAKASTDALSRLSDARHRQQPRIASSLGWSTGTDLASKAAVLIATLVAIRALSPALFGAFVGLSATATLGAAVWDFGLSQLLTREVAASRVSASRGLIRLAKLRAFTFPALVLVLAVGMGVIGRRQPVQGATMLAFASGAVLLGCNTGVLAALRGRMRFREAGLSLAAGRWTACSLSFLALGEAQTATALTLLASAVALGELVTLLFAITTLVVQSRGGPPGDPTANPLTIRSAYPFYANSILATAYNRMDVVILAALTSANQLGFYAPASRLQDALYLLPSSIGFVALPLVASRWKVDQDVRAIGQLTRRLIAIGLMIAVPCSLAIWALAPQAVKALLGSQYTQATVPSQILLWFLPFAVVQAPLLAALAGIGRAKDTTKVFFATFVVALAMHFSLDWWLGAVGGAIASFSRDPVAVVVALLLAHRAGLVRWPWD